MPDSTTSSPVADRPAVHRRPAPTAILVGILFVAMIGLSIWYLTRREPLVIQGEVQSRTFDMAARVDGRIGADRRGRARRTSNRARRCSASTTRS